MGSYLIPNTPSLHEAADFIGAPAPSQTWERKGADVLFTDSAKSDAQCAALYADYAPSGKTDLTYIPKLEDKYESHHAHLANFRDNQRAGLLTPTALNYLTVIGDLQERLADVIDQLVRLTPQIDNP